MRRSREKTSAIQMSLFPFLAVLICTMGALIVLLVVEVEQARVHAKAVAQAPKNNLNEEQQVGLDHKLERQWNEKKIELLQKPHNEKIQKLTEQQLRLGALEEHIRQLEQQLEQFTRDAESLEHSQDIRVQDNEEALRDLKELRTAIDQSRKELEQARKKAVGHPKSYAIIPYQGQNGTSRLPIYIECLKDRIVLQPEGIILNPEDFSVPLGPGNALATLLRAIREYRSRNNSNRIDNEPYPLIIVRSDGAKMYATARQAMKDWDSEFGYELIDSDMNLEFPAADPQLTGLLQHAIRNLRLRQRQLALAAPRTYGSSSGRALRTSRKTGGFVYEDGSPFEGTNGTGGRDEVISGTEALDGGDLDRGNTQGKGVKINNAPKGNGGSYTQGQGKSSNLSNLNALGSNFGQSQDSSSDPAARSKSIAFHGGRSAEQYASESLSKSLGENWGLPNAASGSTGFTRPIRIACFIDRLVIFPERGSTTKQKQINISRSVRESTDEFISAIWKHMEGWGIAGPRSYWKPVLIVQVMPDAQRQFDELEMLLNNSGIAIKKVPR